MRERAQQTVEELQDAICEALEALDGKATFREDLWDRPGGGGGKTRVMSGGAVFEKAGVNTSAVFGTLPEAMQKSLRGDGAEFFATGVSLVLHPTNPHVPTTHANFRYIERGGKGWFGGGADLTPYVLYPEDATHFHDVLADVCDAHDPGFYPRFKTWCDDYFHLPHRNEARGVGGLFFDYITPDPEAHKGERDHDWESLYAWWKACGEAFVPAYAPIVERRQGTPAGEDLRHWQLMRRGRYVEFNLVYDRGTLFGLKTAGRIESILMSLPPMVAWDYDAQANLNAEQQALIDVLTSPRSWRSGTGPR